MSFKSFDLANDVASIVSSINEVVALSSSLIANDLDIKFFNNIASSSAADPVGGLGGYWETLYDASPTSSLSTPLMDMTYGYSPSSSFNVPATLSSSQNEKIKVYRSFASALLGDPDAQFVIDATVQSECFFLMVKRGIQKDEIKKGATMLVMNTGTAAWLTSSDTGAVTAFKQTIGGDYSPLFSGSTEYGQVWYNAGVVVIPATVAFGSTLAWSGSYNLADCQQSGTIESCVDGLRFRIDKLLFHNQTNLYSTVYFCRANNSEFNYSSNPTFVDENKRIRVTSGSNILQTRTYITTVGLYDANDNLLAVAKVNKPITKSPDSEAVFRIRLDY